MSVFIVPLRCEYAPNPIALFDPLLDKSYIYHQSRLVPSFAVPTIGNLVMTVPAGRRPIQSFEITVNTITLMTGENVLLTLTAGDGNVFESGTEVGLHSLGVYDDLGQWVRPPFDADRGKLQVRTASHPHLFLSPYPSINKVSGSSKSRLIWTKKRTASLPSTIRWS